MSLKSFFIFLFVFVLSSCKKNYVDAVTPVQKPSAISIQLVTKLDIDKYRITVELITAEGINYDDYGLAVSENSFSRLADAGVRLISLGKLENSTRTQMTIVVDSLKASLNYQIRAFLRKGKSDYISLPAVIETENITIRSIAPEREYAFASRGEIIVLRTNIRDSTQNNIETSVKIGGLESKVASDYLGNIVVTVPMNLGSGRKTIEINRKGMTFSAVDTLDILRGAWVTKGDFPYPFQSMFGVAQVNETGYMIGGLGATTYGNDFYKYDLNTEKWSGGGATFPRSSIYHNTALSANNKLYTMGGIDTMILYRELSTRSLYQFDPASNSWSFKSPFPGVAKVRMTGFTLNNKLYFLGGSAFDGSRYSDLWEYDPSTDKWQQKARFPDVAGMYPAVFAYEGKALIFGGLLAGTFVSNEFWQYDAVADKWSKLPMNFPVKERYRPICFVMGNKGYMIGGATRGYDAIGAGDYVIDDAWELDLITKKWSRIANNPDKSASKQMPFYEMVSFGLVKSNTATIYDLGKIYQFRAE